MTDLQKVRPETSTLAQEAAAWRSERIVGAGNRTIVSRKGRTVPVVLKQKTVRNGSSASSHLT
jgi:hypothetical protein